MASCQHDDCYLKGCQVDEIDSVLEILDKLQSKVDQMKETSSEIKFFKDKFDRAMTIMLESPYDMTECSKCEKMVGSEKVEIEYICNKCNKA